MTCFDFPPGSVSLSYSTYIPQTRTNNHLLTHRSLTSSFSNLVGKTNITTFSLPEKQHPAQHPPKSNNSHRKKATRQATSKEGMHCPQETPDGSPVLATRLGHRPRGPGLSTRWFWSGGGRRRGGRGGGGLGTRGNTIFCLIG